MKNNKISKAINVTYNRCTDNQWKNKLCQSYWQHYQRINEDNDSRWIVSTINLATGLFNSGTKLYKAIKGKKTKSIDSDVDMSLTINNYTQSSMVLSKTRQKGSVTIQDCIAPEQGSIKLNISDLKFGTSINPWIYLKLDNGEGVTEVRFEISRNEGSNPIAPNQIKIQDVRVESDGFIYSAKDGWNVNSGTNQTFNNPLYVVNNNDGTQFYITASPVSHSECSFDINILQID